MTSKFEKSIFLPCQREKAFLYHANVNNLAKLLPGHMRVEVLSGPAVLKLRDKVRLKVSMYLFSFIWESRIIEYEPDNIFIDQLEHGPFFLWKHYHIFETKDGKTLMTDKIEYGLPLGILGHFVDKIFVKNQLERIFAVRHKMAQEYLRVNSG